MKRIETGTRKKHLKRIFMCLKGTGKVEKEKHPP
jgi:hypothetical protein